MVRSSSAWSRRSRSPSGPRSRTRAAASSSASGSPSRRRQISAIASACSAAAKPGLVASARAVNSATASSVGERIDGVEMLGGDPQRNAARDEEPQLGAAAHKLGDIGRRVDDLLEVVEDEQHLAVADERDDAVGERALLRLLHVERRCERGEEAARVGHVGEPGERRAVGELRRKRARDLGRKARLPDSARSGHRHDAIRAHEVGEVRELPLPAEQLRARFRQRRADRDDRLTLAIELCRSGTTSPSPATAYSSSGRPTFLNWNEPSAAISSSSWFLTCSYAVSERRIDPGTANDSTRAATLTASPVSRSGSTRTSPTWMPIRTGIPAAARSR